MTKRLRVVPEGRAPIVLDPGMDPAELSDDWQTGWRACRETLSGECEAWYARGLATRPTRQHVVRLDLIACVVSFIAGMVIAAGIAAG